MWRHGLPKLVVLIALALAALLAQPAEAAPCPHERARPASGSVEVARLMPEPGLAAPAEPRSGGMAAACCPPSCCVSHCPALLPMAGGEGVAPCAGGRQRPGSDRLAQRLRGDGPWRPPPLVLAR